MTALPPQFTPDPEQLLEEEEHASWRDRKRSLYLKLSDARTLMLMKHHFFGRLALKMKLRITEDVSTAAVRADATCFLNPKLIDGLREDELGFVIAHELMHLAFGHFDRVVGKDPGLWNQAGDYVINAMLRRAGLPMPERADLTPLYDYRFERDSDEQVYFKLLSERLQLQPGAEHSSKTGRHLSRGFGRKGGDCDFGATPGLKRQAEASCGDRVLSPQDWRDEVGAAAQAAKSRGQLPEDIERWIAEIRGPMLPWQVILSRHVSQFLKSGSDYRRPARRSTALRNMRGLPRGVQGLLPGPRPDRRHVVIAIDTSGSMSAGEIRDALSEVGDILTLYKRPIRVMCCDTHVHVDEDISNVDEIAIRGGGGTRTEPVFERIEEEPGPWGAPALCIFFSDLMASFPPDAPAYPVLWVNTMESEAKMPPFGTVIDMYPEVVRG